MLLMSQLHSAVQVCWPRTGATISRTLAAIAKICIMLIHRAGLSLSNKETNNSYTVVALGGCVTEMINALTRNSISCVHTPFGNKR